MTEKNENRCPLCSRPNKCAVSEGKTIEECWCSNERISDAALASLPEPLKPGTCICRECALSLGESVDGR